MLTQSEVNERLDKLIVALTMDLAIAPAHYRAVLMRFRVRLMLLIEEALENKNETDKI